MPFIESDLENLIIDQIKNKDYEYVYGENLERNYEDIIIEKDLIQFLESKYINEEITKDEITSIISSLKSVSNADLYDANKRTFIKMVDGENFTRLDRSKKDFYLQLFNAKTFDSEHKIKTQDKILSINLMKDKETLLLAFKNDIKKIYIINNKLKIKNYLHNINIFPRVKIVNYKDGIAWASKDSIFLFYNSKKEEVEFPGKDEILGSDQSISVLTLFEYDDEILLYLYYFSDDGSEWESLNFNYLKKGKNIYKNIIMETYSGPPADINPKNAYKINKFGNNKVIIFVRNEINIINMLNIQKIQTIKLEDEDFNIYNSYILNDSYVLLFLRNSINNMIIYKINDNYSQIVLNSKIETGDDDDLYFYSLTNNFNNCKLISIGGNIIYFHEIVFNIKKTSNLRIEHRNDDAKEERSENEKSDFKIEDEKTYEAEEEYEEEEDEEQSDECEN